MAQLARLARQASKQPVRHCPRHPGRDLPDEGLCLGAQGAADADDKGEKPQTACAWLVGWQGILAWRVGLLEEAVGTPRPAMCGRVSVRNEGISGRLTRLDLQDRVAARPVEALQDNVRLVSVRCPSPGKRCMKELIRDPAPAVAVLADDHPRSCSSQTEHRLTVFHNNIFQGGAADVQL